MTKTSPRWKTNLSKFIIASLVFPSGIATSQPIAMASGNEVLINEVKFRGAEYIELYNAGSEVINLDDWIITSAENGLSATLNGNLDSGQLITFEADNLDNSGDIISLKNSQGETKDYVSYGYGLSNLPTTDTGKAIARKSNGSNHWLSNVEPTPGQSNDYSGPSVPTNLKIDSSEYNPINTINLNNQSDTVIVFNLENSGKAEVQAWDLAGTNKNKTEHNAVAGGNSLELNLSTLVDGEVYLSAYSEDESGVKSSWSTPKMNSKDTIAPQMPTVTNPISETNTEQASYLIKGLAPEAYSVTIFNKDDEKVAQAKLETDVFEINTPLQTGDNDFNVISQDSAWNWSHETEVPTITAANLPLSAPLNLTAEVNDKRVELTWDKAVMGGEIDGYHIYSDNKTGEINYLNPIATTSKNDTDYTTIKLNTGSYRFAVRSFNDQEESTSSNIVKAIIGGDQHEVELERGEQTVNLIEDNQFWLKTSASTLEDTTFSVEDFGSFNPTNQPIMGKVAVGSYFDITTSNTSPFPIELRIFYTQDDLDEAGVSREEQLTGIYYYSEEQLNWQMFEETGVNIDEINIDGQEFKGFFWAKTDHLTPIVGTADIEAPSQVKNFQSKVKDSQIHLSWNQVDDADSYKLRYKAANANTYTYLSLNSDQSEILILDLKNYTNYEFGIAAKDKAGNVGSYVTVSATPIPSHEQMAIGGQVGPIASTDISHNENKVNQEEETVSDPKETSDEGDIQGGEDERSETENTRSLVTILIIVVAAAAGFGGYYAYQWWTAQPDDISLEDSPPKRDKEEKKKSKKNDSGRW